MKITSSDIISRRKELWAQKKDISLDSEFVKSVAEYIVSDDGAEIRNDIYKEPDFLIEMCCQIDDKDGKLIPFFLNAVQRDIKEKLDNNKEKRPVYVLKGRQQGVTSYITARQACYTIVRSNFKGFTIADCPQNTRDIFNDKARVLLSRLPSRLRPHEKYNSRTELFFDKLNSSWRIATASDDIARSKTLHFIHLSEIGLYKVKISEIQASLGQTATQHAQIVYETTAKGFNQAKDLWDSESCLNLFYPWWLSEEYSIIDASIIDKVEDKWLLARIKWLKNKGLNDNQIAWYVDKFNRFLDNEIIRQEYPCYAEEAFLSSGSCYFDKEIVYERIRDLYKVKPLDTGYFNYDYDGLTISNISWVSDALHGYIKLYKQPDENAPYVIGGDTAGEGSDFFTGQVLNNSTAEQVAVFKKQLGEELYARQMFCLGKYYSNALIGLEVNFSTYPTKELERLGYPNHYLRQKEDDLRGGIELKHGFRTGITTRPPALAEIAKLLREDADTINDVETLREMLTFVKNEDGKPEAEIGKHDDLVMALAIAHYIRPQQSHLATKPKEQTKRVEWTKDQYDDYRKAPPDMQAKMLKMWGSPE